MEKLTISEELLTQRIVPMNAGHQQPLLAGESVVYIMSRDQRTIDNYGLTVAQDHALRMKLPLIVVFCFLPNLKYRAREHFDFMLTGLDEVAYTLHNKNIPFVPLFGRHHEAMMEFSKVAKPAMIVTDFSPLRGVRKWQSELSLSVPLIVVDSHNCVPVWQASQKQEFSARTLRPKIHRLLDSSIPPRQWSPMTHPYAWKIGNLPSMDSSSKQIHDLRNSYAENGTHVSYGSGEKAAHIQLNEFIQNNLKGYAVRRNDPSIDGLSGLSPYLHFGSIGAMTVVRSILGNSELMTSAQVDVDALIEELVVRKELSDNFCYYNNHYNSLLGAPKWAQDTLAKHASDPRVYIYTREQFEQAVTHDQAWNAAQKQLRISGKMHGYMRMYWAKKILEWSESPELALETALYLNDFYSIDGGDPNGYVGVLWSIAGLHDRPWGERAVYGTVRSMVYNGLKRKFDIETYIQKYES